MAIKLNIGSGYKRYEGFLNVDDDPLVKPDHIVQLDDVNIKLPFEDNTVDEIKAYHIFEHIGAGFIPLIKELYRVAEHGCILDIHVPHHQHDMWYGDPTHVRFITVASMNLFSQKFNKQELEKWGSSSGMGLKYNIDWEMIDYNFLYDAFYGQMLDDFFKRQAEGKVEEQEAFLIQRLLREATNVAAEVHMKMVAVKE